MINRWLRSHPARQGLPSDIAPAGDGVAIPVRVDGNDWIVVWHRPSFEPEGKRHGATAVCLARSGDLVLISEDGKRWWVPGGRPEGQESWEDTLRREVREEACADVAEAKLLGFIRAACTSGPEEGLVLVRSQWRATVDLAEWEPQFEVPHRQLVPAQEWRAHVWVDEGWGPIVHRFFAEAGLA